MSCFTEEERRQWDLAIKRSVDRVGGPENARKRFLAPTASEVLEAAWEEPSQHLPSRHLPSPPNSEHGDTPTSELFGESSPPSPYLQPQKDELRRQTYACWRENPLSTSDAPKDPAYYTRRTHFDEGELEGLYDYVYDDITLNPRWRHMKNSKPRLRLRPESVIGSTATKRSLDDDLPVSRQSKKQKVMADQDTIDHSRLAQSQETTLDTPRPASSSRTAAEIGREVRRRNFSSLKRRKLRGYAVKERLRNDGAVSAFSDDETEAVLPISPAESEVRGSTAPSESDSGANSHKFNTSPTTPEKASDDEEHSKISQTKSEEERSPPCGLSQTTEKLQESSIPKATVTPGNDPLRNTLTRSEVDKLEPQSNDSSDRLEEPIQMTGLLQNVLEEVSVSRTAEKGGTRSSRAY